MPITDFTLNNPKIRGFFQGDSPAPVGELMYVHSHLIQENFLSEIEILLNQADLELLKTSKKPPNAAFRIKSAAEKLAPLVSNINESNAVEILNLLKVIYSACNSILGTIPK